MMRRPGIRHVRAPALAGKNEIWPPTLLSGCVCWVDMLEAGSFSTLSGTVTSVTNKATGGAFATAVTAFPLVSNINGRPAMAGDGARGILSTDAALVAAFSGTDLPFTVIYVMQSLNPGAAGAAFSLGNSAAASGSYLFGTINSGNGHQLVLKEDSAGGGPARSGLPDLDLRPHVVSWVSDGTTVLCSVDGIQHALDSNVLDVGLTTLDRAALFVRPRQTPDFPITARVGCLIAFNRPLANYERIGLETALKRRWDIRR